MPGFGVYSSLSSNSSSVDCDCDCDCSCLRNYSVPVEKYDVATDATLDRLDKNTKSLKKQMVAQITQIAAEQKICCCFSFFNKTPAICQQLTGLVQAIGTRTQLGKIFITDELSKIFQQLDKKTDIKLMAILLTIYDAVKKLHSYIKIDPIEKYELYIEKSVKPILNTHLNINDGTKIADLVIAYMHRAS